MQSKHIEMQVQNTMNEFSQVKTRVYDTYCSHPYFSSLITLALEKSKYLLHAMKIYLIDILSI